MRAGALMLVVILAILGLSTGHVWLLAAALVAGALAFSFSAGRSFEQAKTMPPTATASGLSIMPTRDTVRQLIELLDIPALALDQSTGVLAHNSRARELFPRLEDGLRLHQVSRHPELLGAAQRATAQGTAQTIEMTELAPRGRRLRVTLAPFNAGWTASEIERPQSGYVVLLQFRDLSENDRLAQLRSDFIANASHELRTPLASIKGFIETLQGPASADASARHKFLTIMDGQAARMARILDDLLSLSRIEMREHMPVSGDVDVAELLIETVEEIEPIARDAKISLSFQAAPGSSRVRGDRDELVQVFQNLIQNAIKYGKEGGKVDVLLTHAPLQSGKPGRLHVSVSDDGPGIAADHLPRLTERFYRVDTATSRERGGTGLGLAIVKHILNRHRGELKIVSTLGKGSTFTVVLDAARADRAGAVEAS